MKLAMIVQGYNKLTVPFVFKGFLRENLDDVVVIYVVKIA
jgi:hypothetical protein